MRQSIGRFIFGLVLVTGVGAGTGLGAALLAPGVAGAATTFIVNDAGDFGLASPGTETTCTSTAGGETPTCTLRAAIEASNNLGGDTTITLPDPTTLTSPLNADAYVLDEATLGQLEIDDTTGTVTINGAGANLVSIEGAATEGAATTRVLQVDPNASAVINNVTIANGNAYNGGEDGGGILNSANLTLTDSTVTNNQTNDGPGGGISADSGATTTLDHDSVTGNTGASDGGGIIADGGTMTLDETLVSTNTAANEGGGVFIDGQGVPSSFTMDDNSTVTGNTAGEDGGGIAIGDDANVSQVVDIDASTISDNTTTDGDGAGLAQDADSTLTVTNSTIVGNTASDDGGGFFLGSDSTSIDTFTDDTIGDEAEASGAHIVGNGGANTAVDGAGLDIGEVDPTFTDVTIDHNIASNDGGGIELEGGTNTFTGGAISDNTAGEDGGGVDIESGTNTFTGVPMDGNTANNRGGGAFLDSGTNAFSGGSLDSNTAYEGGGAYISDEGGTDTFTGSDISSNTASESAGGLWISAESIQDPTTITSSTISDNTVPGTIGETGFLGDGGGILAESCIGDTNQINLTNDTIAGNTASALGGGYFGIDACQESGPNQPAAAAPHVGLAPGVTNFVFDTIDANTSAEGGGNVNTQDASTLNASETIISNGVSDGVEGTNCTFTGGGTVTSGGHNLIDDTTCGTAASTDVIGQPAQLGALGNNGGPTSTELPASTSPAVGAVPAAVCSGTGVTTDQRGNARGAGLNGSCTIGSVEVAVAAPPAFNPNGYRLVADEGGIFDFGLNFNGSLANNKLNAPIVGLANSPGPNGYLMVGSDGGVFAEGGANFFGSLGGQAIPSPISAIAAPPSENGYWLAAQNGKIYNYGSAPALPALQLPSGAHIVGMASTTDGQGLWLTDQFGDVYAEGDAQFVGGLGGVHLNSPIVGLAAAASGQGYVLVASDGGVFAYGTQGFFGSVPGSLAPGQSLVKPIVGIAVTHSGNGYWEVGADGGVFNYGDAPFLGSIYTAIGNHPLNGPIVGIQHLGEPSAT
jgi:hypothetical protein